MHASDVSNSNSSVQPMPRSQSFDERLGWIHEERIPRNLSLTDLRVRGAVFRRGPLEYNGCGVCLGTASPRSGKDRVRCGNCGEYDHITIDCVLLADEGLNDQPSLSYLQRELQRSN
ncbi:unnamed protein product [Aphanomyces euteiches]|uniref:Uncharacterized protein n=1 Tax=Aphanomyces euteiches TaxID=100861 RepID=A0A6G0WZ75_9STRA|nr:hypothetical protein Ae201684_010156 [Aphanomyces euteiches]KAH9076166.1 hypothetical protein Ae201684P_012654 [Aphanomyces euteiches]KAH9138981.1 hypothetical protein AeRB84_016740 [Aphanomyces euteiches]